MQAIHPDLNKPVQLIGVLTRNLRYREVEYAPGKFIRFTPRNTDVTIEVLVGAAEALVVGDETISITTDDGVSTLASIAALVAAHPEAEPRLLVSGDAGILTAGFAVAGLKLYDDRVAPPNAMFYMDKDGHWVPYKGFDSDVTVDVDVDAFKTPPDSVLGVMTNDGTRTGVKRVLTWANARVPEPVLNHVIDVGPPVLGIDIVPLLNDASVQIGLGAGPIAVTVGPGNQVNVADLAPGVSTVGDLQAAIAAVPEAAEILGVDGDPAHVFGAAYSGLVLTELYANRPVVLGSPTAFCPDTGRRIPITVDQGGVLRSRSLLREVGGTDDLPSENGVVSRLPMPRTVIYDPTIGAVLAYTARPLQPDVTFATAPGGAPALTVVDRTVTATVVLGATTLANVQTLIAANPDALGLVELTGNAGVFPIGFAGATSVLWDDATIQASARVSLNANGRWAPAPEFDFGSTLAFIGSRRVVGVDLGAYVPPAAGGTQVTFTGVDLNGRIDLVWNMTDNTLHRVQGVVTNPTPPAVGNFNVAPPVRSANAVLVIPFLSVPHAYDLLADANRTNQLNPPQGHIQGPVDLEYTAAVAEAIGTYYTTLSALNWREGTLHLYWNCSVGGQTYSWDIEARMNADAANPDWQNINSFFQVGGSALGLAAQTGTSFISTRTPIKAYEFRIARTKAGGGNNSAIRLRWGGSF